MHTPHVFIIYTTVNRISCDGWGLPAFAGKNPNPCHGWLRSPPTLTAAVERAKSDARFNHTIPSEQLSVHVWRVNVEALEYTGPVPYMVGIFQKPAPGESTEAL